MKLLSNGCKRRAKFGNNHVAGDIFTAIRWADSFFCYLRHPKIKCGRGEIGRHARLRI